MGCGNGPMETGSLAQHPWPKLPPGMLHMGSFVWWEEEPSSHQEEVNAHAPHIMERDTWVPVRILYWPLCPKNPFSQLSSSFQLSSFCLEFVSNQLQAPLKDKPQNTNCVILMTPHPSEMQWYLHLNWPCTIQRRTIKFMLAMKHFVFCFLRPSNSK